MIELEPKELVSIIITRREIESGDISNSLSVLNNFKKTNRASGVFAIELICVSQAMTTTRESYGISLRLKATFSSST